jgi:CHASE3 domain sensor protein
MRYGFGTARRLALGFGLLVLLIAGASAVALAGSSRVHAGLEETKRREEGVRLSLELASAVRDQYAHQAHTIIIGDDSHLEFYREARETVARLTRALRQAAQGPDERTLVDRIEAESVRLDGIFR